MKIARISECSGIERIKDLPITQEEIDRWKNGELIQVVWPHLSDQDREFIQTGIVPEEWAQLFPQEEDFVG